jgi:hypothetical protein
MFHCILYQCLVWQASHRPSFSILCPLVARVSLLQHLLPAVATNILANVRLQSDSDWNWFPSESESRRSACIKTIHQELVGALSLLFLFIDLVRLVVSLFSNQSLAIHLRYFPAKILSQFSFIINIFLRSC